MDAAFAGALNPAAQQQTVLGLPLQPMRVGHLYLLEEIDCAYPHFFEQAQIPDLFVGVLVCSFEDHHTARRALNAWWSKPFMRAWRYAMRNRVLLDEALKFQVWLCDELRPPETKGAGGEMKAPLPFRLESMLRGEFGITDQEEILRMPVRQALCLWATEADRRGQAELLSERQLAFKAWAQQRATGEAAAHVKEEEGNAS